MIKNLILVGLGGFFGSSARYFTSEILKNKISSGFPLGTFIANILGAFLIGVLYGVAEKHQIMNPQMRLLLMTGFCGGYTTFSSFAYENLILFQQGNYRLFFTYTLMSIILGLGSVYLGVIAVKG